MMMPSKLSGTVKKSILVIVLSVVALVKTAPAISFVHAANEVEVLIPKNELKKSALMGKLFPVISELFAR